MRHYGSVTADPMAAAPVTAADRASNRVIEEGLRAAFPHDAILSEEGQESSERLDARRIWIVDPLDGTKEFLARNGEFSIMIGLVMDGEAILGVVYRPDGDTLYAAARGHGAWIERGDLRMRLQCQPPRDDALRLVVSRSHGEPLLARMQEALGIDDAQPAGSVGVKCGLIAEGKRDLYIHPVAHLKEWDTCAPEVILREAGGQVCDCRGDPLRYNKPEPVQPHGIVACAPGIRDRVLTTMRPLYEASLAASTNVP